MDVTGKLAITMVFVYFLVGRDGNYKNVPLSIAFVHKETYKNFTWFYMNYICAGIDLTNTPMFVDHGCQHGEQQYLQNIGYPISLKFGSWHISLNVC
jgi:hypothetical protein